MYYKIQIILSYKHVNARKGKTLTPIPPFFFLYENNCDESLFICQKHQNFNFSSELLAGAV